MSSVVSGFQRNQFIAAACHALPHRKLVARIAGLLMDCAQVAGFGNRWPFFTHCKLAALRGVLHRNTSREIIRELEAVGLIETFGYRPNLANRFLVRWANLRRYLKNHKVQPLQNVSLDLPRTKADWDKEREAYKGQAAAAADERRQREADRRREQKAASERAALRGEERRAAIAGLGESLSGGGAVGGGDTGGNAGAGAGGDGFDREARLAELRKLAATNRN